MPLIPHMGRSLPAAPQLLDQWPETGLETLQAELVPPAAPAGLAHAADQAGIAEQPVEDHGQLLGVVAVHQEAGPAVGDHLLGGARRGRRTWLAGAHGLQIDEAEAFSQAGHDEGGAAPVELGQGGLADESGEGGAAGEPERRCLGLQPRPVVTVARDDQPDAGEAGEGFQDLVVPL